MDIQWQAWWCVISDPAPEEVARNFRYFHMSMSAGLEMECLNLRLSSCCSTSVSLGGMQGLRSIVLK